MSSTVCRPFYKIETMLLNWTIQAARQETLMERYDRKLVFVDATEQAIETTSRKKQKAHYSGKKKCHTQKAQLIINQATLEIIATAPGHDGPISPFIGQSRRHWPKLSVSADSGYQGINQITSQQRDAKEKVKKQALNCRGKGAQSAFVAKANLL